MPVCRLLLSWTHNIPLSRFCSPGHPSQSDFGHQPLENTTDRTMTWWTAFYVCWDINNPEYLPFYGVFCIFYFWLCYSVNWSNILSHNVFMFCDRKCVKVWTMWFFFTISLSWLCFIVLVKRTLMLVINLSCLFLNFVTKPVRVGARRGQKVIWVWRFDSVAKRKKRRASHTWLVFLVISVCLCLSLTLQ